MEAFLVAVGGTCTLYGCFALAGVYECLGVALGIGRRVAVLFRLFLGGLAPGLALVMRLGNWHCLLHHGVRATL